MGYEPVTFCESCGEPFDVYRAPDDRICDACLSESLDEEYEQLFNIVRHGLGKTS